MQNRVSPKSCIRGVFNVPSDKSISQRVVIMGALAEGKTTVRNLLESEDVLSTIGCIRGLGINIDRSGPGSYEIYGKGLSGLSEPEDVLNAGNSGTCMRLLSGVLAAQNFYSVITGDGSLRSRPMSRIIEPLKLMGADVTARGNNRFAPLTFRGGNIRGIEYNLPVASAQVKSCLLLAGLFSHEETVVTEPARSRDHTENMLRAAGADIQVEGLTVRVRGGREIAGFDGSVPGDISSAAFLVSAALIAPDSEIRIESVGLNPTRTGFLDAAIMMGADIKVENRRKDSWGEETGDIIVKHSPLKGIQPDENLVPSMIDELPLLAVLGAYASGRTVIRGASELRVKECDRIEVMANNLKAMGAAIEKTADGFVIEGGRPLMGAVVNPASDHRMAMAVAVAALGAESPVVIENSQVASVSFPGFWELAPFCS